MSEARRRAAIYARYSTDLQRDRSIEDQVALCRDHAAREGLSVTAVYSDRARTSASLIGRDGIQDLLADAKAGAFDVVVVEALDRLSRDQADLAGIHKRLEFAGVHINACGGGVADALQIGVHGLLGQIWLGEHKKKVRRGQAGVVRDGRHAGGKCYGYRSVPGKPGELEIVAEEAEVIRRIFSDYVSGLSPRTIAGALNSEGIPPPRGTKWNASTLNGNPTRGYGVLWNDLYRGEIVWNRVTMILDPETGKRISRVNPEDQWQRAPAEHLRIVPEHLFTAARNRKSARKKLGPGRRGAAPKRLLSGLLRCGCCGGGMSIQKRAGTKIWIRCSTGTESGACTNRTRPRLDLIENAIINRLAAELQDPIYIREYLRAYHEERERVTADARRDRGKLERALLKAQSAFKRAHDLYVQGVTDGPEAIETLKQLKARQQEAQAAFDSAEDEVPAVELHPGAVRRYLDALTDLGPILSDGAGADFKRAAEALRDLISEVVVTPAGEGQDVEVRGYLSALLGDHSALSRQLLVAEDRLKHLPTVTLVTARVA